MTNARPAAADRQSAADGFVEVACMVDRNGVNPTAYGLPAQMAAICDSNMRMYDLAATAAIERSRKPRSTP